MQFANAEARRVLGGRLAEGDALPEPWQGFSLREFAAGLFERARRPRAGARDARRASTRTPSSASRPSPRATRC